MIVKLFTEHDLEFLGLQRLVRVYTCQNATLLKISCRSSFFCFRRVLYGVNSIQVHVTPIIQLLFKEVRHIKFVLLKFKKNKLGT